MNLHDNQREDSDVGKSYKNLSIPAYKNGTPYSDEAWQKWYAHKSNKEMWIENQEEEVEK